MAHIQDHYSTLLAEHYSWSLGGFESALARNREVVKRYALRPRGRGSAVDAGAGCGFLSIPLAEEGFSVYAIDTDARLLRELEAHAEGLPIVTIRDDLRRMRDHVAGDVELVVCATDTILLLDSRTDVLAFFRSARAIIETDGRLVLTFRDLSQPVEGLDRFIPVRADERTIFTCFVEYERETVKVHDLVYVRRESAWELRKSDYRKLRLSCAWVVDALTSVGFERIRHDVDKGLVTVVATAEE